MKSVLPFVFLLLFFSCNQTNETDFRKINSEVSFQYHELGDGQHLDSAYGISVNLLVTDTLGDTLHYVPNYPYFIKLKETAIDSAWKDFRQGDSVSFLISRFKMNEYFKFYKVQQSDSGYILLNARIIDAFTGEEEMESAEKKALSKREIVEQAALKKYIKKLPYALDTIRDIYISKLKTVEADAEAIKYGSDVSLHYTGQFLNGYIFDNTYEKGVTPSFEFGRNYQLIDGMQIGLKGLKKGEKVKIILSSRRAFGEAGSLAGIVPPYTAVIYDVQIVNVIN